MALQIDISLRGAGALDFFQDSCPFSLPAVRRGLEVVVGEVDVNGGDQLGNTAKAAIADDVVGQLPEEALNQVKPRGAGGREVNMHTRVLLDPRPHHRMLVGRVVVDDQVQVQLLGCLPMELLQESQPLDMGVLHRRGAEDPAIEVIEGGKQRHGAMADVIVGAGANMTDSQRQTWLRPFQRLALAFLVAAQDQRLGRRIQVQADHVPKLCLKVGIAGQLERPRQVRLNLVRRPYALHAGGRNTGLARHRAHAPARAVRRRPGGLSDDLGFLCLSNRRLPAATRCVTHQAVQTQRRKPPLPPDHRRPTDTELRRCCHLRAALRARQYNARPAHHPLRRGRCPDQPLQFAMLSFTHFQGYCCARHPMTKYGN